MPYRSKINSFVFILMISTLNVLSLYGQVGNSTTVQGPYRIFQREQSVQAADGTQLWACFTFPVSKKKNEKFPALLIMDPYSGDCTLNRYDEGFLASNGYVVAMFHVRGTGRSEGKLFDREYSEQELKDAVHLINWFGKQKWFSGNAGMYGGSWSGFNALQVAMQRPKALKAIVAYVATENLYHEDVHYADGIFRFDDYNMLADLSFVTTSPPNEPLGETYFQNRFDQPPLSLRYLKNQRDGDFWRTAIRLNGHPDTLQVPTYLVAGWYDGYRTSISRALKQLKTPVKAVVGPWDHSSEFPEPKADLTKNILRWWDYWLKGKHTGILDDPTLVAYMRRPYDPLPGLDTIPGYWQQFSQWPPKSVKDSLLYLSTNHQLMGNTGEGAVEKLKYVPTAGSHAGIWWGEVMGDQRPTDSFSLVFESSPITTDIALLGQPTASLFCAASAKHANWVVRLSDVAPDGSVTLITGSAINGTHRESSENPSYLIPGNIYPLAIPLHFTSWVFEKGHKIRISVSNGLWPMFWPTPYPITTSLYLGGKMPSTITLPLIPIIGDMEKMKASGYMGSTNIPSKQHGDSSAKRQRTVRNWIGPVELVRNEALGKSTFRYSIVNTSEKESDTIQLTYTLFDADPAAASMVASEKITKKINGHTAVWEGETSITGDSLNFFYKHKRTLFFDGKLIRRKDWQETIPRDFQ